MVLSFVCVSVCVREMYCGWHTCRFMPVSVVYHMCVNLCMCVRTQALLSYLQRHTGTEHTDNRKPYRSQHRHTVYSDKQTHTPLLSSGIFIQLNERKCAVYCMVYACVFLSVCVCACVLCACMWAGHACNWFKVRLNVWRRNSSFEQDYMGGVCIYMCINIWWAYFFVYIIRVKLMIEPSTWAEKMDSVWLTFSSIEAERKGLRSLKTHFFFHDVLFRQLFFWLKETLCSFLGS